MGKICPICNEVFPPNSMTFVDFETHVDAHYSECHGPICPVCSDQFPEGMPHSAFEQHVNGHFSDA